MESSPAIHILNTRRRTKRFVVIVIEFKKKSLQELQACSSVNSTSGEECDAFDHCQWDFSGLGIQYQVLFLAVNTITIVMNQHHHQCIKVLAS